MAKKDLNEDILSGGSISDGSKSEKSAQKAAKKAESNAAKAAKKAEKIAAKRKKLEDEIKSLKEQLAAASDEKEKKSLEKKLASAKNKLASLNGKKTGIASNQAKAIKSVVAAVVIVALLVAYVGTGAVRKGFIHSTLQWTTGITAATVTNDDGDKIRIPVSTYNYYFALTYNQLYQSQQTYEQYGIDLEQVNLNVDFDKPLSKQTTTNDDDEVVTWLEYLNELVLASIEDTYTYYNEAVKANGGEEPEITEDQQAELDETIAQYKSTANSYGYTVSGYLVQAMGKGVTESVFRREATRGYIAQNYQEELTGNIAETEYTDEDYLTYQQENPDDMNAVSFRIFECANEDEAVEFKNALKSDGSNFTSLAEQYAEDAYKGIYAQDEASTRLYATRTILQNSGGYAIATSSHTHEEGDEHSDDEEVEYPGLDWLFSTDRKAGDIYQYSTSVVYIISPVALSEASTVNVRHILISPITDEDDSTQPIDATAEQWQAALETAQQVLDEFNSGDRTEDSFAALVSTYSSDTGSSSNGGLYEDVRPGQMVTPFEAWALDPSRKAGDVDIVQTEYGYHIMYFSESTGTPIWKYVAQSTLASQDSTSATEALAESYTSKMNWFGKLYVEKDTDIDS